MKAYKILEPEFRELNQEERVPSRVNRCLLEEVGRIFRAQLDRKEIYDKLKKLRSDPKKWNYRILMKEGIFVKAEYVTNIKEQALNFRRKNERDAKDYYELQKAPQMKKEFLTYAPDDGQAMQMEKEKGKLKLKFKVYNGEKAKKKWDWCKSELLLPKFLDDKIKAAPDIRTEFKHGEWLVVLDYKVKVRKQKYTRKENFLTVDWGANKLLTICAFNKKGEQISQPIFLNHEKIQRKILRIRQDIDQWKSKRDKKNHPDHLKKCNREIAKRWKKIRNLNKVLSHLGANAILCVAQLYNCSNIYIEWLKSLKSKKNGAYLNWKINSTIRQSIFDIVKYKSELLGMKLGRPVNPVGTSMYCPHCGNKGEHFKASDNKKCSAKSYPWFVCPACSYNADRDYVATLNIARKVLFCKGKSKSLKNMKKGIVYKKVSLPDMPLRQDARSTSETSRKNDSGPAHMNGWFASVFLTPKYIRMRFNACKGSFFGAEMMSGNRSPFCLF